MYVHDHVLSQRHDIAVLYSNESSNYKAVTVTQTSPTLIFDEFCYTCVTCARQGVCRHRIPILRTSLILEMCPTVRDSGSPFCGPDACLISLK